MPRWIVFNSFVNYPEYERYPADSDDMRDSDPYGSLCTDPWNRRNLKGTADRVPVVGWIIVLAVLVILGYVMVLMAVAMPRFKLMQKLVDRINLVAREILTGLSVIRRSAGSKKRGAAF